METIRIKDKELFKRIKVRAAQEELAIFEMVEKALKHYLSTPAVNNDI